MASFAFVSHHRWSKQAAWTKSQGKQWPELIPRKPSGPIYWVDNYLEQAGAEQGHTRVGVGLGLGLGLGWGKGWVGCVGVEVGVGFWFGSNQMKVGVFTIHHH